MIKVKILRKDNFIQGFIIEGHANYDHYGKDIVCSAVSILTQALFWTLRDTFKGIYEQGNGYMKVKVTDETKLPELKLLFKNFLIGITALEEQYPKHVGLGDEKFEDCNCKVFNR